MLTQKAGMEKRDGVTESRCVHRRESVCRRSDPLERDARAHRTDLVYGVVGVLATKRNQL
jgi:hypothetical protein